MEASLYLEEEEGDSPLSPVGVAVGQEAPQVEKEGGYGHIL